MLSDLKAVERFEELRRLHAQHRKDASEEVEVGRKSISSVSQPRRVIIVTFHLPVNIALQPDQHQVTCELQKDTPYELFQALSADFDLLWLGWPGIFPESTSEQAAIFGELGKLNMIPVFLSPEEIERGYKEFSQQVLWRILHYLPHACHFNEEQWKAYEKMNETFLAALRDFSRASDLFFIADAELMLLPALVRDKYPDSGIGYFCWANFPSQEIFRVIPWREHLLNGMMAADLIGLYIHECLRHFLSAVYHVCGHDNVMSKVAVGDHEFAVEVFPITLYTQIFMQKQTYEDEADPVPQRLQPDTKYVLSIDYLDGTKSLTHMVNLYEAFLYVHPDQRGKVTLILVALPAGRGRQGVQADDLSIQAQLNATVARINGSLGTMVWTPIIFMNRDFTPAERVRIYRASSVAFMANYLCNCTTFPYEYIGSRESDGVLVLSENSAAAVFLSKSLVINPFDPDDVVTKLKCALDMPVEEQRDRMQISKEFLRQLKGDLWAMNFVYHLVAAADENRTAKANLLVGSILRLLLGRFEAAKSRLVILSYDGTLVGFTTQPERAFPDADLKALLHRIGSDSHTTLVLNTGRDRATLDEWFDDVNVDLVAEHGIWIRRKGKWQKQFDISNQWMQEVALLVQSLVDRTPGSFMEKKEHSIAWHYRNVDAELGNERIREVKDMLLRMTANTNLHVIESSKVIDIKASGFHKGNAVKPWLSQHDWDLVIAIGNSPSDEETFRVLSPDAYTIKVGRDRTSASLYLFSHQHVRPILRDLAALCEEPAPPCP